MKTELVFICFFIFASVSGEDDVELIDEPVAENKWGNPYNNKDNSLYLRLISPERDHLNQLKNEAQRLRVIFKTDHWLNKLRSKMERAKFIVNERLLRMATNLSKTLKSRGFNSIIKYHRDYNRLQNPIVNPIKQMVFLNKLSVPLEMQNDPNFVNLQSNLNEYANVVAESVAQLNSGMFSKSASELYPDKDSNTETEPPMYRKI